MYLIVLNDSNRIRAARDYFSGDDIPEGRILVENLPDGNLTDYLYQDGEYIYDPLPRQEEAPSVPSDFDRLEAQVTYTAMMTDTLLED